MTFQQLVLGLRATKTLTLIFTVGLGALSACSSDPGANTRTGLQIEGGVAGGSGGASNGASGGSVSRAGSSGKGGGATSAGGGTSANAGGSVSAGGQAATGGATSGTGGSSGSTGTGGAKSAGGASASDGGGTTCGGRRGNVCAADEYCDYGAGPSCGAADNTGLCTKRPTVCTNDCPGICGCDSKFYCNACGANAAGVPTTGDKSCMNADDSGTPTCTSDAECGAGLKCCYPCGRIGCKNACIKPLSPGQCPLYP